MHACIYIYIFICICISVYMYICILYTCVYVYIHTNIHIHTYIHTCIHICIYRFTIAAAAEYPFFNQAVDAIVDQLTYAEHFLDSQVLSVLAFLVQKLY